MRVWIWLLIAACGGGGSRLPQSDASASAEASVDATENRVYATAMVTGDGKLLFSTLDSLSVLSTTEVMSDVAQYAYLVNPLENGRCGLSPDNTKVAVLGPYDVNQSHRTRIELAQVTGNTLTPTATLSAVWITSLPQWSPNSQLLEYTAENVVDGPRLLHIGANTINSEEVETVIWRPDSEALAYSTPGPVDGNGPPAKVVVTSPTGAAHVVGSNFGFAIHMAFAPSGKTLAFIAPEIGVPGRSLFTVDTTSTTATATKAQSDVFDYAWAPDGTKLAYAHGNKLEVLANGGVPVVVADHTDTVSAVHWSHDSQWLAYVVGSQDLPALWNLYVVRADGSNLPQMVSDTTNARSARFAFSPTAPVLAYTPIYPVGGGALYFIDLSSGSPSPLTLASLPDQAATPVGSYPPYGSGWSPDGKKFAYTVPRPAAGPPMIAPTLYVISNATLPPSEPMPLAGTEEVDGIEWSPDSRNLLVRYAAKFSDGTTGAFKFGRVTDGLVQPLDSVQRTALGATWR